MYFTTTKLSNAITSALIKVEVKLDEKTGKWLAIGLPQLERSDYTTFKKILTEIHGKWVKKLDAHVFDNDPTVLIQEIAAVGCMLQMKPHDAFFTPRAVVEEMLDWGDFWFFDADEWSIDCDFHQYLEPQAGQGNICEVLREEYPKIKQIDCCEIDPFNRDALKRKGFNVIGEDFLSLPPNPIYRWVIMNPPFNGKAGDYVEHIQHAFKFLEPRGRLMAIVPASFLNSTIKRIENFRNWVFTYGSHARLPEKAFAESGTNVDCVMLRIDNLSDERIAELETSDSLYDSYDTYTGEIVVALHSESEWDKHYCRLIDRVRSKKITTKEELLKQFIDCADAVVRKHIVRYECDFRWDDFTKPRFAECFYRDMVEGYFNRQCPFESEKSVEVSATKPQIVQEQRPLQLSLFAI